MNIKGRVQHPQQRYLNYIQFPFHYIKIIMQSIQNGSFYKASKKLKVSMLPTVVKNLYFSHLIYLIVYYIWTKRYKSIKVLFLPKFGKNKKIRC